MSNCEVVVLEDPFGGTYTGGVGPLDNAYVGVHCTPYDGTTETIGTGPEIGPGTGPQTGPGPGTGPKVIPEPGTIGLLLVVIVALSALRIKR